MAENDKNKAPTHVAYGFQRQGRKFGRWLEVGVARADDKDGTIRVFIDRMVVGGFTGGFLLSPVGKVPELPQPPPRRPGDEGDDDPLDS
jgi:hypothetical protein